MAASLRWNAVVNTARVGMNVIFPLITFPYVSRVLGPASYGKVEFVQSIVMYFIVFSSFGIPLYGIREIARIRQDRAERDKLFSEIFTLHALFTGLILVAYLLVISCFPFFRKDFGLYLLFSAYIVLSLIGVDWFYQGEERYSYITVSSLVIKILSLGILFGFVKTQNDIIPYCLYVMSLSVGSNLLNAILVARDVRFRLPKLSRIARHLRPVFAVFLLNFIGSFYLNLDKAMLGFLSGDYSVGIYAAANKVTGIVISLVTSVNAVMLPRISYYLGNDQEAKFKEITSTYATLLLAVLLPAVFGLWIVAPDIMAVLSGNGFAGSSSVLRILAPVLGFIGLSHFSGVIMLYPKKKEWVMMYTFLAAAGINVVANFILIPRLGANGAAISAAMAEGIVVVLQMTYCIAMLKLRIKLPKVMASLVFSVTMAVLLLFLNSQLMGLSPAMRLASDVLLGSIGFAVLARVFLFDELKWVFGTGNRIG